MKAAALASAAGTPLPPQAPPFLDNLPLEGAVYDPQQPATKDLKEIIENYYGTFFENAIKTVSAQKIPELERIKTLNQFNYYVDALVTWKPCKSSTTGSTWALRALEPLALSPTTSSPRLMSR